jgi:hypothetical protein
MWICVKESLVALLSGRIAFAGLEPARETFYFSCLIFL